MSEDGNSGDNVQWSKGKNRLLFSTMSQRPTKPAPTTEAPKPSAPGPLFSARTPALTFSRPSHADDGDDSGGGHQATPATTSLSEQVPEPDRATPGLFATGKSSTSTPLNPNMTRKLQSASQGGLTPMQYFGEKRKTTRKPPAQNLANPRSPINKILGPRLGKK